MFCRKAALAVCQLLSALTGLRVLNLSGNNSFCHLDFIGERECVSSACLCSVSLFFECMPQTIYWAESALTLWSYRCLSLPGCRRCCCAVMILACGFCHDLSLLLTFASTQVMVSTKSCVVRLQCLCCSCLSCYQCQNSSIARLPSASELAIGCALAFKSLLSTS